MKMIQSKYYLLLSLIILTFNGLFGQESSDNKKIAMLREFYKSYTFEIEKIDVNWQKVDSITERYCTKRLLDWWENAELYYDPFINAQDLNPDLYNILKIKRDYSKDNKFIVTYNYSETAPEFETKIELIVISTVTDFKIDQILIE